MRLLIATALLSAVSLAGSANAAVVFFEGFDGYSPLSIARGATGGTSAGAFTPAATSTTGGSISTDYSYRVPNGQNGSGQPNSMYDEGTWTIGTNPFAVHDLWVHEDANTNPFLMLNGATTTGSPAPGITAPVAFESGAITVAAGSYTFSYDQLNLCCNANGPANTPSNLELWYTDASGASTVVPLSASTTSTTSGWQTVSGTFVIPTATTIRLGLVDNTSVASGNDFGVDNISLFAGVPEPGAWLLMILGFGGLGSLLRRRRVGLAV